MNEPLSAASRWIWTAEPTGPSAYVLFVRSLTRPRGARSLRARIAASTHYELFVDGGLVARGPVPAERGRALVDDIAVDLGQSDRPIDIAIVVHHERGIRILAVADVPPGLRAEFSVDDGAAVGTDPSWRCLVLPMWRSDAPRRGWALGACEDYDASLEPDGWQERRFPEDLVRRWPAASLVAGADEIWRRHEPRPVPMLIRRLVSPVAIRAWRAPGPPPGPIEELSAVHDGEPLHEVAAWRPYWSFALLDATLGANAFTCDLGAEFIGHYSLELDAPAGVVIEISGAELLRDGRPWILRKGTRYTTRYRTRDGRQRFTGFSWTGLHYLHLVIRGEASRVRLLDLACCERRVPLPRPAVPSLGPDEEPLRRIAALSRRTLELGVQEHLIDCPTREQAQYWGDGAFIARSLGLGWGDWSYLRWFLDCFIHAPLRPDGQISCVFPGEHVALVDYSLIPVIAQRFAREATGAFHRPRETLEQALRLKRWYDERMIDGLVRIDHARGMQEGTIVFIDHPGLGWHDFPHIGIERDGASCALNTFFFGFLETLAEIAAAAGDADRATSLRKEAGALREAIRATFLVDGVFHDAIKDGRLASGTSWQTNSLAVYFGLITGAEAERAMRAMLDGYDRLCRCSPYFHFWFLPALRRAGLENEARALIVREWGPMIAAGATTTWEGFAGDAKDSLCHPWSAAPYAFLLEAQRSP